MTYAPKVQGQFGSAAMGVHGMSRNHTWETPRGLFETLHTEFAFTIDLAASSANALLPRYYDEQADALLQDWSGERGFCNPPYDRRRQRLFIEKASFEQARGATTVMLLPARTDTIVWHEVIFRHATEIRFLRGRIRFVGKGTDMAPFPSAIIVFRSQNQEIGVR